MPYFNYFKNVVELWNFPLNRLSAISCKKQEHFYLVKLDKDVTYCASFHRSFGCILVINSGNNWKMLGREDSHYMIQSNMSQEFHFISHTLRRGRKFWKMVVMQYISHFLV